MSDVDEPCYYDEGDFGYVDEYGTADDLAEHALPSPVWITFDPEFDAESPATDWEEYLSDEFYDEATVAVGKHKRTGTRESYGPESAAQIERQSRKRRVQDSRAVPQLRLPKRGRNVLEPTVVWKSKDEASSPSSDVVIDGEGKKVSLLKDWREKFGIIPSEGLGLNQHASEAAAERSDPPQPEKEVQQSSDDPPTLPAAASSLRHRHKDHPRSQTEDSESLPSTKQPSPCERHAVSAPIPAPRLTLPPPPPRPNHDLPRPTHQT